MLFCIAEMRQKIGDSEVFLLNEQTLSNSIEEKNHEGENNEMTDSPTLSTHLNAQIEKGKKGRGMEKEKEFEDKVEKEMMEEDVDENKRVKRKRESDEIQNDDLVQLNTVKKKKNKKIVDKDVESECNDAFFELPLDRNDDPEGKDVQSLESSDTIVKGKSWRRYQKKKQRKIEAQKMILKECSFLFCDCDTTEHPMESCPHLICHPTSRNDLPESFFTDLTRIIRNNYDKNRISLRRLHEIEKCIDNIKKILSTKFPAREISLELFGSSCNGFGTETSDLDIFLRFDREEKDENGERMAIQYSVKGILQGVADTLRQSGYEIVLIMRSRIPIVKFKSNSQMFHVEGDISYNNDFPLYNTKLLKKYCDWTTDNKLAQLGLFVKQWAKTCGTGNPMKDLSSYAYILLLIHFLQQTTPLLPVLQEMGERGKVIVDDWDVYFYDGDAQPNWSQNQKSTGELFIDFLEFYSTFNWRTTVVQIRQLLPLSKVEKKWEGSLMCIEDPFKLDHNLGGRYNVYMFVSIIKTFIKSRTAFLDISERKAFCKKNHIPFDEEIADKILTEYMASLFYSCQKREKSLPNEGTNHTKSEADLCEKCDSGKSDPDEELGKPNIEEKHQ